MSHFRALQFLVLFFAAWFIFNVIDELNRFQAELRQCWEVSR